MNQENSNQPLNYDFITSQGGGTESKKPKDRKLIVIIVLSILTLLMIATLALTTNSSVKESSSNNQQIPEKHLALINQNKTQEALDMYVNAKDIKIDYYQRIWVDKIFSMYDISNCRIDNKSDDQDKIIFTLECPLKDNPEQSQKLTYDINKSDGKIIKVSNVNET